MHHGLKNVPKLTLTASQSILFIYTDFNPTQTLMGRCSAIGYLLNGMQPHLYCGQPNGNPYVKGEDK